MAGEGVVTVEVGSEAPDFELQDQTRRPVRLSDFRGKKDVVVVFFSAAFTGVCESELAAIRDSADRFDNDDVAVLAISCDSTAANRAWADQHGFDFPLLSDFWPHGAVARRYGVFDERLGVALRGTFIVDREGVVRYRVVNPVPDARDHREYLRVLEGLGA